VWGLEEANPWGYKTKKKKEKKKEEKKRK